MKLQSRKQKTITVVAIVAAVILVLVVAALLIVPAVIKDSLKTDPYIAVSVSPKNEYFVGEKFDPKGLKIQVFTGDNETSYFVSYPNSELKISGFDSSVANESLPLTITYKGMTTTLNVTIKEYPAQNPTLVSIRLSDSFYETPITVLRWNRLGPVRDGVNLVLTYDDGSEKEIPFTADHYPDYDNRPELGQAGTVEFTIAYAEGGVVVRSTVTVTITE